MAKSRKFKYPKLTLLAVTIVFAIVVFHQARTYDPFHDFLISFGLMGTFVAGIFYAYGFTSAPATAVLLVLAEEQNLLLSALIGGIGALISDIAIFAFIRTTFLDEINALRKESFIKFVAKQGKSLLGRHYRHALPALAGILIASPLPSEIGITLMAGIKKISFRRFVIIAYLLHTFGIFLILLIGRSL